MASLPSVFLVLTCLLLNDVRDGVNVGVYGHPTSKPVQIYPRSTAGLRRVGSAVVAPYNNAIRQLVVNQIALEHGAGTGTGQFYGVPGTWINADTVAIVKRQKYYGDPESYGYGDVKGYPESSAIYVVRAARNDDSYVIRRYADVPDVLDTSTRSSHLWYYAVGNDLYQDGIGTRQTYGKHQTPKNMHYYYNMLQSYGFAVPRTN